MIFILALNDIHGWDLKTVSRQRYDCKRNLIPISTAYLVTLFYVQRIDWEKLYHKDITPPFRPTLVRIITCTYTVLIMCVMVQVQMMTLYCFFFSSITEK